MKQVVEAKIRSNLRLTTDSRALPSWIDPPVNPTLFFYVFNLTNEEAFLAGREKPNLVELGPYAYTQDIEKVEVTHTPGEEAIRYMFKTVYTWSHEQSERDEQRDVVVVPNIPLFGGMVKMKREGQPQMAKNIFVNLMESYDFANDTKPFVTVTVKEFLWGYPSILMGMQRAQSKECTKLKQMNMEDDESWDDFDDWDSGFDYEENKPKEEVRSEKKGLQCDIQPHNLPPFGLLHFRNNTPVNAREIITGKTNLTSKGLMVSWKDKRRLDFWTEKDGSSCNSLDGSRDPGGLPLNMQKDEPLSLFLGQVGRKITFAYQKEVFVPDPTRERDEEGTADFRTYRYVPEESTFDNPADNPENACYCLDPPGCLPSGLHDIYTAEPGSPVLISWPHFLYGDPALREAVDGMRPDPEKHNFLFDVHPVRDKVYHPIQSSNGSMSFRNTASRCARWLASRWRWRWTSTLASATSTTFLRIRCTCPSAGWRRA